MKCTEDYTWMLHLFPTTKHGKHKMRSSKETRVEWDVYSGKARGVRRHKNDYKLQEREGNGE
jgi:hypothetical protein